MIFWDSPPLTSKTCFRCVWRNCAMFWPNCSRKLKNHPSLPQRCLTTKAGHSWPRLAKRRTPRAALKNSRCNVTPKESRVGQQKKHAKVVCIYIYVYIYTYIWVHTYFHISGLWAYFWMHFPFTDSQLNCLKIQWFTVIFVRIVSGTGPKKCSTVVPMCGHRFKAE